MNQENTTENKAKQWFRALGYLVFSAEGYPIEVRVRGE
jgi:hypothetical protein